MTSIKEDLIKAREKIEKGWCQGVNARDAQGEPTLAEYSGAVQFCVMGALIAVCGHYCPVHLSLFCRTLQGRDHPWTVNAYNDHPSRTQEEVLALFDKAIALAEKEGDIP